MQQLVPRSSNMASDTELQELFVGSEVPRADGDSSSEIPSAKLKSSSITAGVSRRLYISHFLSTWNSRLFEFGAVLFIAKIFPGTLLPVSLYAVIRSASAILLSPTVGTYIDSNDRLKVVRFSIGKSFNKVPL